MKVKISNFDPDWFEKHIEEKKQKMKLNKQSGMAKEKAYSFYGKKFVDMFWHNL